MIRALAAAHRQLQNGRIVREAALKRLVEVVAVFFKVFRQREEIAVLPVLLARLLVDAEDAPEDIRQLLARGDHQRDLRGGVLLIRKLLEFKIQSGLLLQPFGEGVVLVVRHVGVRDETDRDRDRLVARLHDGHLAVVFFKGFCSCFGFCRLGLGFGAAAGGEREQHDCCEQQCDQFFHISVSSLVLLEQSVVADLCQFDPAVVVQRLQTVEIGLPLGVVVRVEHIRAEFRPAVVDVA